MPVCQFSSPLSHSLTFLSWEHAVLPAYLVVSRRAWWPMDKMLWSSVETDTFLLHGSFLLPSVPHSGACVCVSVYVCVVCACVGMCYMLPSVPHSSVCLFLCMFVLYVHAWVCVICAVCGCLCYMRVCVYWVLKEHLSQLLCVQKGFVSICNKVSLIFYPHIDIYSISRIYIYLWIFIALFLVAKGLSGGVRRSLCNSSAYKGFLSPYHRLELNEFDSVR